MEQGDSLLIIDDLKGREVARRLDQPITGTLGVLTQAKLQGHILSLKATFDKIRKTNFCLNEQLLRAALRESGENFILNATLP